MLIYKMGQGECHILLCLWRRPKLRLYIPTTKSLFDYLTSKTNHPSRSVDADFQNGAGRMSLSLLHIKVANMTFLNVNNQSPLQLSKMEDQKSSTLCWHSFGHRCICNVQSFDLAYYMSNGVLAALLSSLYTFSFITTLFIHNTYKYILENIL